MFLVIRAFMPGMLKKGRGSIINMASVASSIKGLPNRFVYGASKAAVIGLTKSIAADFVSKGIRCNAICAGHGRHAVARRTDQRLRRPGRGAQDFVARQPMGRLAKAEEIAPILVFLASDESAFATGTSIQSTGE